MFGVFHDWSSAGVSHDQSDLIGAGLGGDRHLVGGGDFGSRSGHRRWRRRATGEEAGIAASATGAVDGHRGPLRGVGGIRRLATGGIGSDLAGGTARQPSPAGEAEPVSVGGRGASGELRGGIRGRRGVDLAGVALAGAGGGKRMILGSCWKKDFIQENSQVSECAGWHAFAIA